MANTKRGKRTSKKRTPRRGPASRAKTGRRKRAAAAKAPRRKTPSRRKVGKKSAAPQPPKRKAKGAPAASRVRARADSGVDPTTMRGLGPEAGGQSGDTEGLSTTALADSESVEELLEEGQAFEAGIVSGVENARDADRGGVRTRQVPEDDVPPEYLDED